ncbi:TATA-binding -associated phospho protein [Rutstroemia sp. NJR-2017a WRK4]|nr:TATA-binding -associated phospho protein [Rutstroemia sp. NJR-2017a WRK4]
MSDREFSTIIIIHITNPMEKECECFLDAWAIRKGSILKNTYQRSWSHKPSCSLSRNYIPEKPRSVSFYEEPGSPAVSDSSYFGFKEPAQFFNDLESSLNPTSYSYYESPYSYRKQTLSTKTTAFVPQRASSLAFDLPPTPTSPMIFPREFARVSSNTAVDPGFSASLEFDRKNGDHVKKVLDDLRPPLPESICPENDEKALPIQDSLQWRPGFRKPSHLRPLSNHPPKVITTKLPDLTLRLHDNGQFVLKTNQHANPHVRGVPNTVPRTMIPPTMKNATPLYVLGSQRNPRPQPRQRVSSLPPSGLSELNSRSKVAVSRKPLPNAHLALPRPTRKQQSYQVLRDGDHDGLRRRINTSPASPIHQFYPKGTESLRGEVLQKHRAGSLQTKQVVSKRSQLFAEARSLDQSAKALVSEAVETPRKSPLVKLSSFADAKQASKTTNLSSAVKEPYTRVRSQLADRSLAEKAALIQTNLKHMLPWEVSEYLFIASQLDGAGDEYIGFGDIPSSAATIRSTSPILSQCATIQHTDDSGSETPACSEEAPRAHDQKQNTHSKTRHFLSSISFLLDVRWTSHNQFPPLYPSPFLVILSIPLPQVPFTNNPSHHLATVQKIVTEILPASSGLAFGKDARDLLIECCVEFITLISSEANEISEKESKKTIACEHITKALEQLGFGEYVQDIMEVASEHKEQLKGREKKANKLEQSGLSTEQLLAMQEEAFRDAAQRHG